MTTNDVIHPVEKKSHKNTIPTTLEIKYNIVV